MIKTRIGLKMMELDAEGWCSVREATVVVIK
jgi:hypothetical protein